MEKYIYGLFAIVVVGLMIVAYIYLNRSLQAQKELQIMTDFKNQFAKELTTQKEVVKTEKTQRQNIESELILVNETLKSERLKHEKDIDAVNKALDASEKELKELKANIKTLTIKSDSINALGFSIYQSLRENHTPAEIAELGIITVQSDWEDNYLNSINRNKEVDLPITPYDDAAVANAMYQADLVGVVVGVDNSHQSNEPVVLKLSTTDSGTTIQEVIPAPERILGGSSQELIQMEKGKKTRATTFATNSTKNVDKSNKPKTTESSKVAKKRVKKSETTA